MADAEWHVVVVDDKDAAVTGATVVLVLASAVGAQDLPFAGLVATHNHAAGGKYEPIVSIPATEGDWVLVVRLAGKSPVVQPLRLRASGGELVPSPRDRTAATVSMVSESVKVGANKVRRTTFRVKLHPSSEVVFVCGTDYFDKRVEHRVYADGRREVLRRANKIDPGAIVTIFTLDDRARQHYVQAKSGWLKIAEKVQTVRTAVKFDGSATTIAPGREHRPLAGFDISITDVYRYLDGVGKNDAHRVKEASIFSHAFSAGPLLFDTNETPAFRPPAAHRDPLDFDGRPKDFNAANMANWPDLAKAFAADGRFWMWGCRVDRHLRHLMKTELDGKTAADAFVTVDTDLEAHGGTTPVIFITERTIPKMIRWRVAHAYHDDETVYLAAAAKRPRRR